MLQPQSAAPLPAQAQKHGPPNEDDWEEFYREEDEQNRVEQLLADKCRAENLRRAEQLRKEQQRLSEGQRRQEELRQQHRWEGELLEQQTRGQYLREERTSSLSRSSSVSSNGFCLITKYNTEKNHGPFPAHRHPVITDGNVSEDLLEYDDTEEWVTAPSPARPVEESLEELLSKTQLFAHRISSQQVYFYLFGYKCKKRY
jgi:hypothetical protein